MTRNTRASAAAVLALLTLLPRYSAAMPPQIAEASIDDHRISIEFDQPMLTWGDAIDAFPSIRIEPGFECGWRWDDDTHLLCSGRSVPRAATRYRIHVGDGLWSQHGLALAPIELELDSDRPSLWTGGVEWDDRGRPNFIVGLDSEISADAAVQVLELQYEDGRHAAFIYQHVPRESRWAYDQVQVTPLELPTEPTILSLHVRPGLRSQAGPLTGVQDEVLSRAQVGDGFRLREVRCNDGRRGAVAHGVHCPPGDHFVLRFSRPLSATSMELLASTLPEGLELVGRQQAVSQAMREHGVPPLMVAETHVPIRNRAVDRWIRLELPESLVAADGSRLVGERNLVLRAGSHPSQLLITPVTLLAAPGSQRLPTVASMNLSAGRIWQRSLGNRTSDVSIRYQTELRNEPVPTQLPAIDEDVTRHGGMVEGLLVSTNFGYRIGYAGLQLVAGTGDGEVLVWVTSWEDGRPRADAVVELLVLDAQTAGADEAEPARTIATATTDMHGLALLPVRDVVPASHQLLVRAEAGGQRSVLPLRSRWRPLRADPREPLVWGVTDRPLYRPGDIVRYRLWSRYRDRNRLLGDIAPGSTHTLVLEGDWSDESVMQWPLAADGAGAIHGELRLPDSLVDDHYCIRAARTHADGGRRRWHDRASGACFAVTRVDSAEIWSRVEAEHDLARDGGMLGLRIESGFYSGGPAPGARIELHSLLMPVAIEEAYPEHAGYRFADVYAGDYGHDGESLLQSSDQHDYRTDADGHARIELRLPAHDDPEDARRIPFGRLQITASAHFAGQWGSVSAPAELLFSRHRRYVGLELLSNRLCDGSMPTLRAIVVDEGGREIIDASIEIEVFRLPSAFAARDAEPERIGGCTLLPRQATECPVPLSDGHRYRLVAGSDGALATNIERQAGRGRLSVPEVTLRRLENHPAHPDTARIVVGHPYRHATVLLTLEHDGLLWHDTYRIGAGETELSVPLDPSWAPGGTLTATVIDTDIDGRLPRTPDQAPITLRDSLRLTIERRQQAPLELHLPETTAPGAEFVLTIKNPRSTPVDVVVAVVDDGLIDRVDAEILTTRDPHGPYWLGKLEEWKDSDWTNFSEWNPPGGSGTAFSPALLPHRGMLYAATGRFFDGSGGLDRIEVTGARISAADVFVVGKTHDDSLPATAARSERPQRPRVRSRFLDSAHWQPALVLAAGERQELRVQLPDNLTRWRVLAWAADADDGFSLSQAAILATLAVETRIAVPRQLYAGDAGEALLSARHLGDEIQHLSLTGRATGAGIDATVGIQGEHQPGAPLLLRLPLLPEVDGEIEVFAEASGPPGRDAVARFLPVAGRFAREHASQTGWLDREIVQLPLPAMADDARSPALKLRVGAIDRLLGDAWLRELRDYQHACWEQRLSRALGAALWLRQAGRNDPTAWPDAGNTIDDALADAAGFLAEDGLFAFFPHEGGSLFRGHPVLSAYSLIVLRLLEEFGHPLPSGLLERVELAVAQAMATAATLLGTEAERPIHLETVAILAGALPAEALEAEQLAGFHALWPRLSWHARARLTEALLRRPDMRRQAQAALSALHDAGEVRGLRRVLSDAPSPAWTLGSAERDQCALITTLARHDRSRRGNEVVRGLLRGLLDLHAGSPGPADTQAAAQCLLAFAATSHLLRADRQPRIRVSAGEQSIELSIADNEEAVWQTFEPLPEQIEIARRDRGHMPLSYVVSLGYERDQALSQPYAVGIGLERHYAVLRAGQWQTIDDDTLREGDWIRVQLLLDSSGWRHFVAITDPVPGAWVAENLELLALTGIDAYTVAAVDSPWFDQRRFGDDAVRLYAQSLPPGRHAVHYYARVVHAGRYLAPPATAELMYGRASHARTGPATIEVEPAPAR